MNPNQNLFVYGTLRGGDVNESAALLHRSAHLMGRGKARGRLYLVADYPGLVPLAAGDHWVYGEVYRLNSPESVYNELDRYEGCAPDDPPPHEYRRTTIPVLLESGNWIEAIAYTYALPIDGKKEIPSGDFLASSQSQLHSH